MEAWTRAAVSAADPHRRARDWTEVANAPLEFDLTLATLLLTVIDAAAFDDAM